MPFCISTFFLDSQFVHFLFLFLCQNFGFAIFCSFLFSFLCQNHDGSRAKLLCHPQRGLYTNESTVASNFLAISSPFAGRGVGFLSCFQKWIFPGKSLCKSSRYKQTLMWLYWRKDHGFVFLSTINCYIILMWCGDPYGRVSPFLQFFCYIS